MPRHPALSLATDGLTGPVYTGLVALARSHASEVFLLNVGDTYLLPPSRARAEALVCAEIPQLHNYAAVQGEPTLLAALEADLTARARPVPREQIQVTSGATSGLDLICRTLLSAGDEVIILAPFWPLIRGVVSAAGATPIELAFFTELDRPEFDLERALASVLSPRTSAVYLNTPHNPTGVILDEPQCDAIARFARRHNLWLLCDEAYDQLFFTHAPPAPIWTRPGMRERCVVAHTLSKSHAMAGARIGFVHGPEAVMPALSGLQTYTTYCAPKPMQLGAARALSEAEGQVFPGRVAKAYATAAAHAAATLNVPVPTSGPFLFFDTGPYRAPTETPTDWLERCARAGLVLTPGSATGSDYGDWARLCYTSVEPDVLSRAMAALARVVEASRPLPR